MWNNLPIKLKECKSLQEFKLMLKQSVNLAYKALRVLAVCNAVFKFQILFYFIQWKCVNIFNLLVGFH